MKRIARTGADHTNYRRTLNRAFLVLSLIWVFAGLIHPLYKEDRLRAQQLSARLHDTSGNHLATQACYDQDHSRVLARDAVRHSRTRTVMFEDGRSASSWFVFSRRFCVMPSPDSFCSSYLLLSRVRKPLVSRHDACFELFSASLEDDLAVQRNEAEVKDGERGCQALLCSGAVTCPARSPVGLMVGQTY